MSQISLNNVSFHYDTPFQEVFRSFSIVIDDKWKTALIGRNGRGKTTLFKLLSGMHLPSSGQVHVPFEIKYFPYFPADSNEITQRVIKESIAPFSFWEEKMTLLLEKGDEDSLKEYSAYFDLFMHFEGYTIDSAIEKEAAAIGLDMEVLCRPFNTLSGGEKTRALILPLFMRQDTFPLLDEPTDHLDLNGREHLAEYLSASKKGFIVASHDRYLLDRCTDHVISINKTDVKVMQGNYSTWRYQTGIEEEFEQRRYENIQRDIQSLEKAAQQKRKWSNKKEKEKNSAADSGFVSHKAAKLMKRATAIERRIENNIESRKDLLKNRESEHTLKMKGSSKLPERLISVNNLAVSIEGREIISGIYLNVFKGDRIAITGDNGTGKTTLLNAIEGTIPITNGDIFTAPNLKIARAYQSPLWQTGYLKDHLYEAGLEVTNFRFIMSAFKMTGEIFDHPLETFSKGQLRKIDLCRTIVSSPQLLIWDEPLNYLDIASREQLEDFLQNDEPTIIFVEHDRFFIESAATEIIRLEKTNV
ncbi:MAG: ABC-F family ATP-binding cassette domain-containing protein [Ignavibacteria bacterium]|jgi:lincosamide and streptogramin A transport system ATP-binding/permease protein|nr:ABC-F family ATP-binding cassette domain-containing protein [Ignavibacteria bacterium]MCU7500318.1 ABC-F family ATP-binding cassette domain-containing protein [Ignavibacteria bacterium]MCU7519103.1 ABC-F family ATP-binding cassette domain-containing protein [Ignavibacteria bacterium]MCU7525513.1 ABC-F family ATP-binding cassette domain-containing protein [Ignavibacteria bacterium]